MPGSCCPIDPWNEPGGPRCHASLSSHGEYDWGTAYLPEYRKGFAGELNLEPGEGLRLYYQTLIKRKQLSYKLLGIPKLVNIW